MSLYARVMFADGTSARSKPIELTVQEPARLAANLLTVNREPGLRARVREASGDVRELVVEKLTGSLRGLTKGQAAVEYLRLEGDFEVQKSGFYQLVINGNGRLRVRVDDQVSLETELANGGVFLPLSLERGWHGLILELHPQAKSRLKVLLAGDQVASVLSGDRLGHVKISDPATGF